MEYKSKAKKDSFPEIYKQYAAGMPSNEKPDLQERKVGIVNTDMESKYQGETPKDMPNIGTAQTPDVTDIGDIKEVMDGYQANQPFAEMNLSNKRDMPELSSVRKLTAMAKLAGK